MNNLGYLKDKSFLRELDSQNNKFYQVRVEVLNKDELVIESIEGRVLPGSSINIDGSSSMRRTCSISFVAEEAVNNLADIDGLLSINKKIRIFVGLRNDINSYYDDIIQFPQGVFVIVQPSINHSGSGCIISLSCKDKMCLLNGECGGNLPTSVTFHAYDQIIGEKDCGGLDPEESVDIPNDYTVYSWRESGVVRYKTQTAANGQVEVADNSSVGDRVQVKQLFYDIIQTLVCNFGNESLDRIFINDVPLEIKQLVRYTGSNVLYYNADTSEYTLDISKRTDEGSQKEFNFNEDVGYIYTPFTYADLGGGSGELISNIGDNVCTILDKIKNNLGNFEYFYDIEGNFIFQEIRNNLNNSYNPIVVEDADGGKQNFRLSDGGILKEEQLAKYGLTILDDLNYAVDFHGNTRSVYEFTEGNGLVSAYTNSPSYTNIKNDFHIWGKAQDNYAIHYHLVIKEKPLPPYAERQVVFLQDKGQFTGALRLATASEISDGSSVSGELRSYTPSDWRAELYLRGLEKQAKQIRPDVYEQELLDLFDSIYDFNEGEFKADMVKNPNTLKYFIDYLEPIDKLSDCSVDAIGQKIYSYQQDSIKKLYNLDVPNNILINLASPLSEQEKMIKRCEEEGQAYSNVNGNVYSKIAIGTVGYTAQEVSRDILYQYTDYIESISIQSIPIYYLEPNTRITVWDQKAGIHGDYIIKSISLPLDASGSMNITATRALERI